MDAIGGDKPFIAAPGWRGMAVCYQRIERRPFTDAL